MLSITDNFLYVIDSEGRQQLFNVDKLKSALQEAFESAGNSNSYLAEDIVCAVEAAMAESFRSDRIFTQSEVDSAINRILENAGYANVAQIFRRANSHLYIALDANKSDALELITRHLGVQEPLAGVLADQVVEALKKLNITSASPALYLELARHYEHHTPPLVPVVPVAAASANPPGSGKILLSSSEALELLPPVLEELFAEKILSLANVSRLYPNFRLSLNMAKLAEKLDLSAPVTELELAPALYAAGEKTGMYLNILCQHLQVETLPLYLILTQLDVFAERYLGTVYPEGRLTALEMASLFRNALSYPVKKVRCRTSTGSKSAN